MTDYICLNNRLRKWESRMKGREVVKEAVTKHQ